MRSFIDGKELAQELLAQIDYDKILETGTYFGTLSRQSGTPDGETAAAYLIREMEEAGVEVHADKPFCLASIPEYTTLRITAAGQTHEFECVTECWSPDGVTAAGELAYDALADNEWELTPMQRADRAKGLAGKVVLTASGDANFFHEMQLEGVAGIISMRWRPDAEYPSLFGSTKVWGNPVPETREYLDMPANVVVSKVVGDQILELMKQGPATAEFTTKAQNGLFQFTQPYAYIPGETDNYILFATHYDGWYKSVVDNALADGFALELARQLAKRPGTLKRGIKFLWLAGHENVPYAGSTYFVDKNFEDLRDHCVAYVNCDVIGGQFPLENIWANTTRMEGEFADDIIEEIVGVRPDGYIPMVQMADQSLWGVNVPLDLMSNGKDPGFWYHTPADTVDNVNVDVLRRDVAFYTNVLMRIANAEQLPVDMPYFLGEVEGFMKELAGKVDQDNFDMAPVFAALDATKGKVTELMAVMDAQPERCRDDVYMKVAGELARICYVETDNYTYALMGADLMQKPVAQLTLAAGVLPENTYPEDYLCIQTKFVRLRNRFVGEMARLRERIDYIIGQWA